MEGKVTSRARGAGMGPKGDCVCPKCGYKVPTNQVSLVGSLSAQNAVLVC